MTDHKQNTDEILIIPEGVTEIADGAFAFCEELLEVRLPDSIKRIGSSAFQECVNLERINLPNGIKEIGEAAFCNCLSLVMPPIPDEASVGALAFHHTKKETV